MGFYLRKSIKAGPFRFNLSKSGLGISSGVPGFRISSGPRGNYVNMGRGGVYYRSSLNGHSLAKPSAQRQQHRSPDPQVTHMFSPNDVVLEDVTGSTALALESTGEGEIVEQLNTAGKCFPWGTLGLILVLVFGLVALPLSLLLWLPGVPLSIWLMLRDQARRSVVLFYDVEDAHAAWFDAFVSSWSAVTTSQKVWRTVQSGAVVTTQQRKALAGVSNVVKREVVVASVKGPKHLRTNVAVPSITVGKSGLYFLPDRVLVRDGKRYSDVTYSLLTVRSSQQQFVGAPGERVPKDSRQVGQTWQYVNVNGGPDKRYSKNPVRPIMLFGHLNLTSQTGLDWRVQTSRPDATSEVANILGRVPRTAAGNQ